MSITKDEYCNLTASAIKEFATDEKYKEISTSISLLAIVIAGEVKLKLFKEEDDN